ncbi:hypothetical protein BOTBODRAFT_65211 [Botryobasidium botryosum FD-172 SS1]|uniref:Uncharacterized protein n=1 Tax=Botryobasidium botryosum (strain FD-172 SS1) TaxID=930990 RepID=A0A067MK68_BOTB1|nr:hypothetical protein BOTBODRAFT_65211 [Botryobasidium botryosum FD-172 SS1]
MPSRHALEIKEIVEEIAFHLVTDTFLGPPAAIIPFLVASRPINVALSYPMNPNFYSRIFRAKFDAAAPIRRYGYDRINAISFADELLRRCKTMRRMKYIVREQSFWVCEEDSIVRDMWTIYLMCIESDGKNRRQLFEYAHVEQYIKLYMDKILSPLMGRSGLPQVTTERSLAIWILWLTTSTDTVTNEDPEMREGVVKLFRPYAFGIYKYDAFHAPWTIFKLPIHSYQKRYLPMLPHYVAHGQPDTNGPLALPTPNDIIDAPQNLYISDLQPKNRTEHVTVYGGTFQMSAPIPSHAAILGISARLQRSTVSADASGLIDDILDDDTMLDHGIKVRIPHLTDSRAYDRQHHRDLACKNPFWSTMAPRCTEPGMFAGDWEGRFGFLDFERFRSMLNGETRAVYDATLADQPQVWRITEHHYVRTPIAQQIQRRSFHSGTDSDPGSPIHMDISDDEGDEDVFLDESEFTPKLEGGPARNAFFPEGCAMKMESDGIVVMVPNKSPVFYKTWRGENWDDRRDHFASPVAEGDAPPVTIHRMPFDPFDEDDLDSDCWNQEFEDIILTGTGHSAWGRFLLKGRVRSYDGMVILMKEYVDPTRQSTWLYRGYITAGGNWIGRWRDTYTPEHLSAYEGIFCVNRRPSS